MDEPSGERCTFEPITSATTNANGAFGPTTATVFAVFESDIGPTECRTGCRIVVRHPTLPAAGRDGVTFARDSSK